MLEFITFEIRFLNKSNLIGKALDGDAFQVFVYRSMLCRFNSLLVCVVGFQDVISNEAFRPPLVFRIFGNFLNNIIINVKRDR